jgi:hypothetical protein
VLLNYHYLKQQHMPASDFLPQSISKKLPFLFTRLITTSSLVTPNGASVSVSIYRNQNHKILTLKTSEGMFVIKPKKADPHFQFINLEKNESTITASFIKARKEYPKLDISAEWDESVDFERIPVPEDEIWLEISVELSLETTIANENRVYKNGRYTIVTDKEGETLAVGSYYSRSEHRLYDQQSNVVYGPPLKEGERVLT